MKRCRGCGKCGGISAVLVAFSLGLIISYLCPPYALAIILAVGLLVLGICRIRN